MTKAQEIKALKREIRKLKKYNKDLKEHCDDLAVRFQKCSFEFRNEKSRANDADELNKKLKMEIQNFDETRTRLHGRIDGLESAISLLGTSTKRF